MMNEITHEEIDSVKTKAKAILDSLGITYDEEKEEALENWAEQYSY